MKTLQHPQNECGDPSECGSNSVHKMGFCRPFSEILYVFHPLKAEMPTQLLEKGSQFDVRPSYTVFHILKLRPPVNAVWKSDQIRGSTYFSEVGSTLFLSEVVSNFALQKKANSNWPLRLSAPERRRDDGGRLRRPGDTLTLPKNWPQGRFFRGQSSRLRIRLFRLPVYAY